MAGEDSSFSTGIKLKRERRSFAIFFCRYGHSEGFEGPSERKWSRWSVSLPHQDAEQWRCLRVEKGKQPEETVSTQLQRKTTKGRSSRVLWFLIQIHMTPMLLTSNTMRSEGSGWITGVNKPSKKSAHLSWRKSMKTGNSCVYVSTQSSIR